VHELCILNPQTYTKLVAIFTTGEPMTEITVEFFNFKNLA
jgi:hypothetical protein